MVKVFFLFLVFTACSMNLNCSGKSEGGGTQELPVPIILSMNSDPILPIDNTDHMISWYVMTVSTQAQFHAVNPTNGTQVDNLVAWTLAPQKLSTNPLGSINQQGKYTAPNFPSWVGVFARADANNPPLRGDLGVEIVAAPVLIGFSASALTISAGQSLTLIPEFSSGVGQINSGASVVQSGLISGMPVIVSPPQTSTYTLVVTNLAGTSVHKDLLITVQ
jgi:hypothetical protein